MPLYRWIITALWLLFIVYWALAAAGAKRNVSRRRRGVELGLRVVLILIVVSLLQFRSLRLFLGQIQRFVNHSAILGWTGAVLCLLGFGLSIYARSHLGRNWGMPMSLKEQPELVTSGPYSRIRHPIYTGLILAMFGSAIAVSIVWALVLVVVSAYFIYSARQEETIMLQQFHETYAAYMARTGMFLPRLRRL